MEVGQHQGLALTPFLFTMAMFSLTDVVKHESLWMTMFAIDIVICTGRTKSEVERRGMKVWGCGKEVKK